MKKEDFEILLNPIIADFKEAYKKKLEETNHKATGQLGESLRYDLTVSGTKLTIIIDLDKYWKYLEFGTRGTENGLPSRKLPPISSIESWMKVRGLPTEKGRVWAIAQSIKKRGTLCKNGVKQPAPKVFSKTYEEFGLKDKIKAALIDAFKKEFKIEIQKEELYGSKF